MLVWFVRAFFAEKSGFRADPVLGENLTQDFCMAAWQDCVCYQHSVAVNAAHTILSGETTKNHGIMESWGLEKTSKTIEPSFDQTQPWPRIHCINGMF